MGLSQNGFFYNYNKITIRLQLVMFPPYISEWTNPYLFSFQHVTDAANRVD
jgi:hypothetical protein